MLPDSAAHQGRVCTSVRRQCRAACAKGRGVGVCVQARELRLRTLCAAQWHAPDIANACAQGPLDAEL